MLCRKVGLVSACALGASAFLIPAGLLPADADHAVAWSDPLLSSTKTTWLVRLPCSTCAFPRNGDVSEDAVAEPVFTVQGGAYDLLLNFTLAKDRSQLELGGKAIYPPRSFLRSWFTSPSTSVEVYQIPSSMSLDSARIEDIKAIPLEVTDSTMKTLARPGSEAGERRAKIIYQINSLNGQKMDLDVVKVRLSRNNRGPLTVVSIKNRPRLSHSGSPHAFVPHHRPESHGQTHCDYLPASLCNLLSTKPKKPCGMGKGRQGLAFGRPRPHRPTHGPSGMNGGAPKSAEWEAKHEEKSFHHHSHHHGLTSGQDMMGALLRGFMATVVSIMVGMFVGMTVSLVGIVIGRIIGYVWIKYVRGGRSTYSAVAASEEQTEALGGAKLPLYEEVAVVYVDEKSIPLSD